MKKLLFLLLTVSIGINLYLVDVEYIVQDDFNSEPERNIPKTNIIDEVKVAQSAMAPAIKKCECAQNLKQNVTDNKSILPIDESEKDIQEKLDFDEVAVKEKLELKHQEWIEKSDRFFIDDLRLSQNQISRYKELSTRKQAEVDNYFNERMKNLNDSGEVETYIYTSEDTIMMGKIAEKYNKLLKENFGAEAYQQYRKFVTQHNKSAFKEDKFFYSVEF